MKKATSDLFLWLTYLVVRRVDGDNDGLVSTESMRWGDFKGIYTGVGNRGISHCDEVDMRRRSLGKKAGDGVGDITDIYRRIIENLFLKGF